MENGPFEDVFPIENGDFPLLCLITGVYIETLTTTHNISQYTHQLRTTEGDDYQRINMQQPFFSEILLMVQKSGDHQLRLIGSSSHYLQESF